jgi:glycosyltransferase involved in cell wall biosynthesis
MKISICIPQYNRIDYLLKSLEMIRSQTYRDIEIIVSDDCSTDSTEREIQSLIPSYKFPIIYHRNAKNIGYDANYRKSIELASGEYVIIIGNDDSIYGNDSIQYLADFLEKNNLPEIGFSNFVEDVNPNEVVARANSTGVLGTGYEVALRNYSCFSFVGGLIYKKSAFQEFNTSKHDGSIFAQLYLGCLMIAKGCRLFSIEKPLVLKDMKGDETLRKSYRDVIARTWKQYKKVDGGVPSVINVLISAFRDAGVLTQRIIYKIFRRIYTITFPHWVIDYRSNGALPEAVGLIAGLKPSNVQNFSLLNGLNRTKIYTYYFLYSGIGLTMPVFLFRKLKNRLYKFIKKNA